MKRIAILAAAFLLSGLAFAADSYKVDPMHSSTTFRASHMNIGAIYGQFTQMSGQFALDEANPSESTFDITIHADSVNTHVDKRDAHLKSPDFLNAKQYPTIHFQSISVKPAGPGKLEVTGNLTLHGVTRPLTLPVEVLGKGEMPKGTPRAGVETIFTIKLSDFEIKGVPGATADELKLMVAVEGTRS